MSQLVFLAQHDLQLARPGVPRYLRSCTIFSNGAEEEEIHYVHTASKGLGGRLCHAVWASLTTANTRAQTDFWSLCHMTDLMAF